MLRPVASGLMECGASLNQSANSTHCTTLSAGRLRYRRAPRSPSGGRTRPALLRVIQPGQQKLATLRLWARLSPSPCVPRGFNRAKPRPQLNRRPAYFRALLAAKVEATPPLPASANFARGRRIGPGAGRGPGRMRSHIHLLLFSRLIDNPRIQLRCGELFGVPQSSSWNHADNPPPFSASSVAMGWCRNRNCTRPSCRASISPMYRRTRAVSSTRPGTPRRTALETPCHPSLNSL